MRYHVGTHLVRAAAARWAGHPSLRRDQPLRRDAVGDRARARAARRGARARPRREPRCGLAGFLPLAADLSFVPGLLLGSPERGGEARRRTSSRPCCSPTRSRPRWRGARGARGPRAGRARRGPRLPRPRRACSAAGAAFLKAFTGAQLLLAFGLAWLVAALAARARARRGAVVAVAVARAGARVAGARRAARACRVALLPFAPTNPARSRSACPRPHGLALVLSGLAWLVLSLGLRAAGVRPALRRAARGRRGRGEPRRAGAQRLADRALRERHGRPRLRRELLLPAGERPRALAACAAGASPPFGGGSLLRGGAVLLLTLAGHGRARGAARARRARADRRRPTVRAMAALRAASCPGDVVLTRPGVARVPPVVVLAGRRVPLANFIPYWRQFTTPERWREREARCCPSSAQPTRRARSTWRARLGARYVYFAGARRAGRGRPSRGRSRRARAAARRGRARAVHVEPRAAVYRFAAAAQVAATAAEPRASESVRVAGSRAPFPSSRARSRRPACGAPGAVQKRLRVRRARRTRGAPPASGMRGSSAVHDQRAAPRACGAPPRRRSPRRRRSPPATPPPRSRRERAGTSAGSP